MPHRTAVLTVALLVAAATACSGGGGRPEPTAAPRALGGTLAFASPRAVRLALPDGSVKTIAEDIAEPEGCSWSGDGRYVAWTAVDSDGTSALHVHEVATGRTATWGDVRATAEPLQGTAAGFVLVYRAPGKAPEAVFVDPARLIDGGKPRVVKLRLRTGELLTAAGRRVLVQQPKVGAAFTGGPSTIYDVTADGRATPLFTNDRDWPVHRAAFTADGRRLVHSAGDRLSQDRVKTWVVVRDLANDRELDVPSPERPGAEPAPLWIVTGADGQTVATVGFRGADGEDVASEAYVLDGDAWRKVADDAGWAATGPAGALAVISSDDTERLTVDGRHLGDDVQCAAWAP